MSVPNDPIPQSPPMPGPDWIPQPPIEEPEPDRLPDEIPVPNPDETTSRRNMPEGWIPFTGTSVALR